MTRVPFLGQEQTCPVHIDMLCKLCRLGKHFIAALEFGKEISFLESSKIYTFLEKSQNFWLAPWNSLYSMMTLALIGTFFDIREPLNAQGKPQILVDTIRH